MAFLSKNVNLGSPKRLSAFRKVALGTWRDAGDPSVYSILEMDCTAALAYLDQQRAASGEKLTFTHFVGKAAAETIRRHPELNCILRLGRLYPRQDIDIFFQVASDSTGEDLSGTTVRQADRKSVADFAREMGQSVRTIREHGDPAFKRMKGTMKNLPGWATGVALTISGLFMYTLNLWTVLLGTPRDPFGSIMITNIGSLGLDMAFAPLVPYSRVPCLIAVGTIQEAPIVRDGTLAVAPVSKLCVTFDHRLIDGVHASRMAATLRKIFANPGAELH